MNGLAFLAEAVADTWWVDIVVTVISGVFTILVGVLSYIFSKKIKDEKKAEMATSFTTLVLNAVNYVSQTYVSELKKTGKWDDAAKKIAKEKCIAYINDKLTPELKAWLAENTDDITKMINEAIESALGGIKAGQ